MPVRRPHDGKEICAIFVHAGAGYHSIANEMLHLGAVNDAAKVGMMVLKNGGDATDAVEMAIRLLEDREITNAGYGSNLTIDGQVECDATMVDHFGRSGAVGAVSQIKNPISLARVVLEASSRPLSLQRVPPNLIVGPGAVDFAAEHGLIILPNDYLVSEAARCRWLAWRQDLIEANERDRNNDANKADVSKLLRAEQAPRVKVPVHTVSPPATPSIERTNDLSQSTLHAAYVQATQLVAAPEPLNSCTADRPLVTSATNPDAEPSNYHTYARVSGWSNILNEQGIDMNDDDSAQSISPAKRQKLDGSPESMDIQVQLDNRTRAITRAVDEVHDTVGCIAIDCFGNIAAGSSSGGIGMKHRGRCGPAALVGIGTAVIPIDPQDTDQTCVATVTSGTGEHMATTAAAATAAERLYLCVRREGTQLRTCNEDEALNSMIKNDFMNHPGVQNQPCVGAIGILAVKKTKDGIFFYFGHNTDSFAIASMHSEERKPTCTMSRNRGDGKVAQGGRVIRSRGAKS